MNFTQSSISLFFVISLYSITFQCSTATAGFVSPSSHNVLTKQQQQRQQLQQPCTNTNKKNHDCNQRHSSSTTMHPLNFMKDIQNSVVSSYSNPTNNNSEKTQTQLNAAPIPTLDNWTITKSGEAIGRVSNHPSPNIIDGEMVTTSKLRNVNKIQAKEGSTVTTASGSKYKLGKPKSTGVNFFRSGSNNLSNGDSQAASAAVEKKKSQQPSQVNNKSKSGGGWSFNNNNSNRKNDSKSSNTNSPTIKTKLEGPLVEDWFISFRGELIGIITGHPDKNIIDGDTVTTSKVRNDRKTLKEGDVAVTVNGSKYVLGKKKRGLPTTLFQNREITTASAESNGGTFNSGRRAVASVSSGSNNLSRTFGLLNKQLSDAITNLQQAESSTSSSKSTPVVSQTKLEKERLRLLKQRYGINGKTLANGKYLLCGKAKRSTSGKSNIWSAYKADDNGVPVGDKLTIKVSTNFDSMRREENNYNRVCSGLFPGRFVEKAEFLENLDGYPVKEFQTSCALVIENGRKDLRAILNERGGRGFEGRAMRDAASAALQCIQAMHSSGIVWTDLKTENFVIVSDEIGDNGMLPGVKGIDLESAIPRGKNPVDFSPEACPPEFASAFISGQGLNFKLEYSYDIWSYGMMLYELTTGKPYFDNKTPAQITMSLQYEFEPDLSNVQDDKLRDLIRLCLQYEPKKRPGVTQLLLHPYFLTTGVGPFGW